LKRILLLVMAVLLALAVAAPIALGKDSKASGKAGDLDAAWWSWAVSTPKSESPLVGSYTDGPQCDGQPVTNTKGKQWFLAGSPAQLSEDGGTIISGSGAKRTCTVPTGTKIFFPIVNNLCATPVDADNPEDLVTCAKTLTDDMVEDGSYYVKVDGKDVSAKSIVNAASSPYTINFYDDPNGDDDNVFGEFGYLGKQTAASAGLYVALEPLPKGDHTIEWGGIFDYDGGPIYEGGPDYPYFQLGQETTYNITVK
jgi:hypothetical protein